MTKIGLEIHATLDMNSKLFCGCAQPSEESEPNSHTCEVCLGMPGSKPVVNEQAIRSAVKLALALNCEIEKIIRFSRKIYFYPDLVKNYQISQHEVPVGSNGYIELSSGKKIRIKRVHLEEDPGALIHSGSKVLIDYNRSGMPLCEIVTEPDIESAEEAREFLKLFRHVLAYLKISDLKQSPMKADVNISIKGGKRVEIKNVSGFKEVEKALVYEEERQKEEGVKEQQTRGWDSAKGITFFMRSKEYEEDYGFILDPDLPRIELEEYFINRIGDEIPELGKERARNYVKKYKLKKEDAEVLTKELALAEMFEEVAQKVDNNLAARWLIRELPRVMNYNKMEFKNLKIDETQMIDLLKLIEDGTITERVGQKILNKLVLEPFDVRKYVDKEKLGTVGGKKEIEKVCKEAIKKNPKAVEDYKAGEEKALNFIVGQIMKETRGAAKPDIVLKLLKKLVK